MSGTLKKVAWIPVEEGSVLFARSKGQKLFYTVGGKIEEGETETAALIREVKEETCVDLVPETIRLTERFYGPGHGKASGLTMEMICYTGEYTGTLIPGGEIEELAWFRYPRDMQRTTVLGHTILQRLFDKGLIK